MKNHTKVYLLAVYGELTHNCTCEICYVTEHKVVRAVDVHHINPRGMGGSKDKDYIENLMGLCRACHLDCEAAQYSKQFQEAFHKDFLDQKYIDYDITKFSHIE